MGHGFSETTLFEPVTSYPVMVAGFGHIFQEFWANLWLWINHLRNEMRKPFEEYGKKQILKESERFSLGIEKRAVCSRYGIHN